MKNIRSIVMSFHFDIVSYMLGFEYEPKELTKADFKIVEE